MPAAMMSETVWRGGGDGVEGGEEHLHGLGALDDAEGDSGGDAERAFGADEDAERDRSRARRARVGAEV